MFFSTVDQGEIDLIEKVAKAISPSAWIDGIHGPPELGIQDRNKALAREKAIEVIDVMRQHSTEPV